MAEKQKTPAFDPSMAKRSTAIAKLNKEEIFNRYVVKNFMNVNSDPNDEIKVKVGSEYKYPLIVSMCTTIGMNYLASYLNLTVKPLLPLGYKLNMENIFTDLEKVYEENLSKVQEANNNPDIISHFTYELIHFITDKITHSYSLNDDKTFTIENN